MFTELSDLSYTRSALQALGFYLAWLLLAVLVAILFSFVAVLVFFGDGFEEAVLEFGLRVGTVMAIALSMGLTYAVQRAKNLHRGFKAFFLIVIAGLLGGFGGGLLGLIIPAYLTTRDKAS